MSACLCTKFHQLIFAKNSRRLEKRATDSPEVIEDRIQRAEYELGFASKYDCIIINDDLETAKKDAYDRVNDFLNTTK